MVLKRENPAALAGDCRVDVTKLAGKNDVDIHSAEAFDLQVRRLLARYSMSVSRAVVVAELVYGNGRAA